MKWPPWSNPTPDDRPLARLWAKKRDLILPTLVLTSGTLTLIYGYRNYVRRIRDATAIYPSFFRHRSLFGQVTSVGDGDNFRLFHTPGGRLLGWGWFPGRKVPGTRAELKDETVGFPMCVCVGGWVWIGGGADRGSCI